MADDEYFGKEFNNPVQDLDTKWQSIQLKYISQINPESVTGDEPNEWEVEYVDISSVNNRGAIEDIKRMKFDEAPSRAKRLVQHGDIIVSTVRTYLKAIAYVRNPNSNLIVSTGFAVIRPNESINPEFLWRVLQADPFIDWIVANSEGVSYPAIKPSRLGDLEIPCPPIKEQNAIVSFLDQKTSSIETLIDKNKKLITYLEERKEAVITVNTTESKTDEKIRSVSKVQWYDSIPSGWKIIRLKHIIRDLEQGWSPQCNDVSSGPNKWGVLKAGCVNNMCFKPKENKELPNNLEPKSELEVKQGDVLISRANTRELVGSCAQVKNPISKLLLCDKLYRIHLNESICKPEYFVYIMNSTPVREQIELSASGASQSMKNISQKSLKDIWVPIPPIDDQKNIISNLNNEVSQLRSLKESINKSIKLLQEKRQTVVTKAVTGQLDLTDWQSKDNSISDL